MFKDESANLDFLRATAVSIVLLFHASRFWGHETIFGRSISSIGLFGVLLFFVHTTMVLMLSLRRQQGQFPNKPIFSGFMLRRIFRIYPLSIFAVLAIVLFKLPAASLSVHSLLYTPLSPRGVIANLLLVQNVGRFPSILGVLWSLPFEIQMYTVLPALFLLAMRVKRVWPLLLTWVVATLMVIGLGVIHLGLLKDLALYVPCFVPGVIAFKLSHGHHQQLPYYLWPPFLGILIMAYFLFHEDYAGWFLCLMLGVAIPFFSEMPDGLVRKSAHAVAKYSYGIYLFHYFGLWLGFMKLHSLPIALQWTVFFLVVAIVPVALFHLIESPMIKVGNRAVRHLVPRMPDVAGSATIFFSSGKLGNYAVAVPEHEGD